jgi:hypothetical protein
MSRLYCEARGTRDGILTEFVSFVSSLAALPLLKLGSVSGARCAGTAGWPADRTPPPWWVYTVV